MWCVSFSTCNIWHNWIIEICIWMFTSCSCSSLLWFYRTGKQHIALAVKYIYNKFNRCLELNHETLLHVMYLTLNLLRYNEVTCASWCLKSPATRLFVSFFGLTRKFKTKVHVTCRWISLTKGLYWGKFVHVVTPSCVGNDSCGRDDTGGLLSRIELTLWLMEPS